MIKKVALVAILCGSWLVSPSGLHAQYYNYFFGRNKVQYTDFQWEIMETEHFEIYYYKSMKDLADRAAVFAEEQYRELEHRFNHTLVNKVPMILYSSHLHFQQTNVTPFDIPEGVGGFFEFLKGRVVLPSDGSLTRFRRVLRHELVHVFTSSKLNSSIVLHKKFNHPGVPLWFTEGLAEVWSGDPDNMAEMVMRDAVISGHLVPLAEIWRIQGTYFMYKESENLLNYIIEAYGEEKILQLLENAWKSPNFEKVFEATIGLDYKAFDQQWTYYLKKKYYPILEDSDAPGMVSQHITEEGFNAKPAFYRGPDGERRVVFVANRLGYTNIYQKSLEGNPKDNKAEVIIEGERSKEYETFHFFRSTIDISHHGRLSFVTKSGEKDVLYVYELEEKRVVHKYRFPDVVAIASPHWSPSGDRIAFSGLNEAGNSDLYVVHVSEDIDEDGKLDKLTDDFYDDKDPSWSPDGKYIAFSSDRTENGLEGAYNIFIHDLETRQNFYVTYGMREDLSPTWNQDGTYLAFTSSGWHDARNISAMRFQEPDGQDLIDALKNGSLTPGELSQRFPLKQVTRFTSAAFDPEWTDTGELLFTGFEGFNFHIRKLTNPLAKFEQDVSTENDVLAVKRDAWSVGDIETKVIETKPYKTDKRFGLDFLQGGFAVDPFFGSIGGAQFSVTDMLGNEQYNFLVYNTAREYSELLQNFNFAITKVNLTKRTNYAYGVYHFNGLSYEIGNSGNLVALDRIRTGGVFAFSYPLSRFRRLEGSMNVSYYEREAGLIGDFNKINAVSVSNFGSYVQDNSLWGPSGPLDGTRTNVTLGYTTDVKNSEQNYYTAIFDYRNYRRLSTRSTFASRFLAQINHGKNEQNFLLGGSWDLRGYPRWTIVGTKFILVNNELRFPLIDFVGVKLPFGGLGFQSIRGAVFADVGNAWKEDFDGFLMSVGTGFRVNLWNVIVLRFDFGKVIDLRTDRERTILIESNDSNGNFEEGNGRVGNDIFFQFFFGYDF